MDIDFQNPATLVLTGVFYMLLLGIIWKSPMWDITGMFDKVVITIIGLPLIFMVCNFAVNKG